MFGTELFQEILGFRKIGCDERQSEELSHNATDE
jgi:hypothetical protein